MRFASKTKPEGTNISSGRCACGSGRAEFALWWAKLRIAPALSAWWKQSLSTLREERQGKGMTALSTKKANPSILSATKNAIAGKGLATFSPLFLAALILLLCSTATEAQTGSAISGQFVTPTGTPASNARVTVCPYTATGTPCFPQANIYSDPSLNSQFLLPQPYALNQYGNLAGVWVTSGSYIIQVQVNQTVVYSYLYTTGSGSGGGIGYPPAGSPVSSGSSWLASLGIQGTDTNVFTAGVISGTGSALCTDVNGGATTVGCGSGTIGGSVSQYFVPYSNAANTIVNSPAFWDSTGLATFTLPVTTEFDINAPVMKMTGTSGEAAVFALTENTPNLVDCVTNVDCLYASIVTHLTSNTGLDAKGRIELEALGTATSGNNMSSNKLLFDASGFNTGAVFVPGSAGTGYTSALIYTATLSGGTYTTAPTLYAVGNNTGGLNFKVDPPGLGCTVPGTINISGGPGSGFSGTLACANGAQTETWQMQTSLPGTTPGVSNSTFALMAPAGLSTQGIPRFCLESEPLQPILTMYCLNYDLTSGGSLTDSFSELSTTARTQSRVDASGDFALLPHLGSGITNGHLAAYATAGSSFTLVDGGAPGGSGTPGFGTLTVDVETAYSGANAGAKLIACLTDNTLKAGTICDMRGILNEATQPVSLGTAPIEVGRNGAQSVLWPSCIGPTNSFCGAVLNTTSTIPTTPANPTVSCSTASGSWPSGTYYVYVETAVGDGNSAPNATEQSCTLASAGTLSVTGPSSCGPYVSNYNVYISTASGTGSKTWQGSQACGSSLNFTSSNGLYPVSKAMPTSGNPVPSIIVHNNKSQFYALFSGQNGFPFYTTNTLVASNLLATTDNGYSGIENIFLYNNGGGTVTTGMYDVGNYVQSRRNNINVAAGSVYSLKVTGEYNDVSWNQPSLGCDGTGNSTLLDIEWAPMNVGDSEGLGRLAFNGITGSSKGCSGNTGNGVNITGRSGNGSATWSQNSNAVGNISISGSLEMGASAGNGVYITDASSIDLSNLAITRASSGGTAAININQTYHPTGNVYQAGPVSGGASWSLSGFTDDILNNVSTDTNMTIVGSPSVAYNAPYLWGGPSGNAGQSATIGDLGMVFGTAANIYLKGLLSESCLGTDGSGKVEAGTCSGGASYTNVVASATGDTTVAAINAKCTGGQTYWASIALSIATGGTIGSGCNVMFVKGGLWTIASGQNVAFANAVKENDAPSQHFTGSGTVTLSALNSLVPVEWFGAVGDWNGSTGTDNTTAIQTAMNSLSPSSPTNNVQIHLQCLSYKVTSTITNPGVGIHGDCEGINSSGLSIVSVTPSEIISTSASTDVISTAGTSSAYLAYMTFDHFTIARTVQPTGTAADLSFSFVGGTTITHVQLAEAVRGMYLHAFSAFAVGGIFDNQCSIGISGISYSAGGTYYCMYLDSADGHAENSLRAERNAMKNAVGNSVTTFGWIQSGNANNDVTIRQFECAGTSYCGELNYTGTGASDANSNIHWEGIIADQISVSCFLISGATQATAPSIFIDGGTNCTGSTSASTPGPAVDIENSFGVHIQGNYFKQPGSPYFTDGVYAHDSGNIFVQANEFDNVTQGCDVHVDSSTKVTVGPNNTFNLASWPATSIYCLTGTSSNNDIYAGGISGYAATGISFGTSTANNTLDNQVNLGVNITTPTNLPSGTNNGNVKVEGVTATSVTDSGLANGNCVQAGAGGLLTTISGACGTGGGGGNYVNIGSSVTWTGCTFSGGVCTVGTAVSTVTISSIPGTYLNLDIKYTGEVATSGDADIQAQFNGDTTSDYESTRVGSASPFNGPSTASFVGIVGPAGTRFGGGQFEIPEYSATGHEKSVTGTGWCPSSCGTFIYGGSWFGTLGLLPITSMSIVLNGGGNFAVGTTFSIYGTN